MDIVLFRNLQDSLKVKTKRTSELANCEISLNNLLEANIDDQQQIYVASKYLYIQVFGGNNSIITN